MSEAATADTTATSEYQAAAAGALNATSADLPIATAGQQSLALAPTTPTVHPAVAAIIQTAQASNPPANWAGEAAAYIQALDPIIQAAEQMSRASPKTAGYVALAEVATPVLIGILQRLFPHPAA